MARRGDAQTLTVDVYDQLRREILTGQLAPGAPLRPVDLGRRFDVSGSVIREALTRLAAHELVGAEHNRGFHVIRLSPGRLEELVATRQLNEGAALELSIEHGDIDWESELVAAHHRLTSVALYAKESPQRNNGAFAEAHRAFHMTLLSACKNAYLLDICHRLFDASELYRRWSAPLALKGPRRKDEHQAIMQAALARDTSAARELYRSHIAKTANLVITLLDPDPR